MESIADVWLQLQLSADSLTYHFFLRDYNYFSVYGPHAVRLAHDFYKSTAKDILKQEQGLPYLTMSRKFFSMICQELLLSNRSIQVWKKSIVANGKHSWSMDGIGTPGYLVNMQEHLLSAQYKYLLEKSVLSAIYVTQKKISDDRAESSVCVGMAIANQMENSLTLLEFDDSIEFTRLTVGCNQYGIRECIISIDNSIANPTDPHSPRKKPRLNKINLEASDSSETTDIGEENRRLGSMIKEAVDSIGCNITEPISDIFSESARYSLLPLLLSEIDSQTIVEPSSSSPTLVKRCKIVNSSCSETVAAMGPAIVAAAAIYQHVHQLSTTRNSPSSSVKVSSSNTSVVSCVTAAKYKLCVGQLHTYMQVDSAVAANLNLFPSSESKLSNKSFQDDWMALHGNPADVGLEEVGEADSDDPADVGNTRSMGLSRLTAQSLSVFEIINNTKTPMGRRLLQTWLRRPLCSPNDILSRQAKVKFLVESPIIRSSLRDDSRFLKGCIDLGSIVLKFKTDKRGGISLWDLLTLYRTVERIRAVAALLQGANTNSLSPEEVSVSGDNQVQNNHFSTLVTELQAALSSLGGFQALVEEVLDVAALSSPSPSYDVRRALGSKWVQVRPSFSPVLSKLHDDIEATWTMVVDEFERIKSKISSTSSSSTSSRSRGVKSGSTALSILQLEYHHTHGFHMRVTKKEENKVIKFLRSDKSEDITVLASLKSGTLFLSSKMATLLRKHRSLRGQYDATQEEIVNEAVRVAATYVSVLDSVTNIFADLDSLCALAHCAVQYDWCCPLIYAAHEQGGLKTSSSSDAIAFQAKPRLKLAGLRHPGVERALGSGKYVPSNVTLQNNEIGAIITGPNMGGKSTFLRAVGIAIILAHIGSFVPATEAEITICDRLLIRTGATDSAADGMSTFMAEMTDVVGILKAVTSRSIVLIDEIGRGTSTHEGFGLAWAVLNSLVHEHKCTTFFATHFHELTALAEESNHATTINIDGKGASVDEVIETDVDGICCDISQYHANRQSKVINMCVRADVVGEGIDAEVVMRYAVERGVCPQSYGIQVAKMVHFPTSIIEEAFEFANQLESGIL